MKDNSLNSFFQTSKEGAKPKLVIGKNVLLRRKIVELELGEELKPEWLKGNVKVFFPEIYNEERGEALAYFVINGKKFPAVLRRDRKIVFNFDIDKTIDFLLLERYCDKKRPIQSKIPFHYHKIPFRIALAKFVTSFKQKKEFPSWPIEMSVETLRHVLLKTLKKRQKVNWPGNKKLAIVLSHDVDTEKGAKFVKQFEEIEESYNFKSTWNFVAKNFHSNKRVIDYLYDKGNEIGCHGYVHDNKLAYLTKQEIRKRFEKSRLFLKEYSIKTFRSPSLLTSNNLDSVTPEFFCYDSSSIDTEIFLPDSVSRGCCTVFPFFKKGIVEVPLTVPMDSTLVFLKYGQKKIYETWEKKVEFIKKLNGTFVINTHPERHFSANADMLKIYEKLLNHLSEQDRVWKTTISGVGEWWGRRGSQQRE